MAAQIGPNLNLNHSWSTGEDGWNLGMDENLIKLDTLNHLSVKSKSIATPPVSPSSGDRYIIASNPTGDWATFTNYITVYINSVWQMYQPKIGFVSYIEDLNVLNIYDSSWITASGGGGLDWEVTSINTTAVKDKGYLINASANNVTILLPGSPAEGDSVGVCDVYNKATTNVITVDRNTNNIEGVAEDLVLDINGAGFIFVYVDTTRGWEIISEIGTSAGIITNVITDGDTTHAPDGNSVFYALSLKAPLISPSFTTPNLGTPASGNLVNCTGGYSLIRVNKTESLSPVTLLTTDCSGLKVFTNTGATADVVMLLPAGADGLRVNAIITAAYDFTFVANGAETIRYLSTVSKTGGSIKSASIGDELQLDWNGTQWVASVLGTSWQLETS
jgi:hypothetical protein